MDHPYNQNIHVCTNEVPGVTNIHTLRGHNFIKIYMVKTFKNLLFMNRWPEYINIKHGASLGPGDTNLYKLTFGE